MNNYSWNPDQLVTAFFVILIIFTSIQSWKSRKNSTMLDKVSDIFSILMYITVICLIPFFRLQDIIICYLAFNIVLHGLAVIFMPKESTSSNIITTVSACVIMFMIEQSALGGKAFYLAPLSGVILLFISIVVFLNGWHLQDKSRLLNSLWLIAIAASLMFWPIFRLF